MGEDTSIGIITSSTSYQYAREVFGPKASILKLGLVNPLPKQKILDFAAKVDKVLVLEELDPVIEDHCRALGLDVLGDSTFMHSGMTGLANIAYNQSNSTVIILDNSTTGMTGHQQNPTTGKNLRGEPAGKIDLETLCRAMGIRRVRVVDPYDLKATEQVVTEELAADEPSVIITRRPCVLLKTVQKHPPYRVEAEACKGCKQCMKIGCPAISWKDKKAVVDPTQCVGCGVCEQLCKFGAFRHEG